MLRRDTNQFAYRICIAKANIPIDYATQSGRGDQVTNLHQIIQAVVTVLAVINPVVCGSLFLALTPNLNEPERRRAVAKVALNILVILMGSRWSVSRS